MPIPSSITALMAQQGMGMTSVYRAVVTAVDPVHHSVSVKGEMAGQQWSGVEIMPMYQTTDGVGSFYLPEEGSVVWLCKPAERQRPFIVGFSPSPSAEDQDSEDEDPLDSRMNRPVLNPGDYVLASQDTAFIILRKGGNVEIGSSQNAKRTYVPLQNVIRDTFESYVAQAGGGACSWKTRRDDESYGADLTPVEYRLQIKEFTEDEPIIDIAMGRVAGEEDFFVPPNGEIGRIVGRFILELPTGERNLSAYLDKEGNILFHSMGDLSENVEGTKSVYVRSTFYERVVGLRSSSVGTRVQNVNTSDSLTVGRSRVVEIGEDLVETIGGSYTRDVTGDVVQTMGAVQQTVAGQFERDIIGNKNETVAGGKQVRVMENFHEVVAMTKTCYIGNAIPGGDAFKMTAANGNIDLSAPLGQIQISGTAAVVSGLTLVQIGSLLAVQPAVLGLEWTALWTAVLTWLDTHVHGAPGTPPVIPSTPILSPLQANALSVKVFLE